MIELFTGIFVVSALYAYVRALFVIIARVKYNKTHRGKVWLVSMEDIPCLMIEFFCLPYLAVRGLSRKAKSTGESVNLPGKARADYVAEKATIAAPSAGSKGPIRLAMELRVAERAALAAKAAFDAACAEIRKPDAAAEQRDKSTPKGKA